MTTRSHDSEAGDSYLEPYRSAVQQHGPGFKATLWGSRETQQVRFDVMVALAGFSGSSIVDVGCGHGDFAAHLLERGVDFATFVGLDALPEIIEAARQRQLDPTRIAFDVADVIRHPEVVADYQPDFTCLSGTLNTMDDATARSLLKSAYERSAQGVIFNFLGDRHHPRWAGRDLTPARRFDTIGWIEWSLDLSSRVSFTQAYLDGHDATVMILHDG